MTDLTGKIYVDQIIFRPQLHLVPSAGGGGEGNVSDGDTLAVGLTFPGHGLKVTDADAHTLTLKSGNLTGNRTLDLVPTGNFTVAPGGNVTLGNSSQGNLTIAGNVTGGNHSGNNTGDESGAGILSKLLPVDGAGSGLDSDTVDGQHASAFSVAGHNHDGVYSPAGHNHDGIYSPVGHSHAGMGNMTGSGATTDNAVLVANGANGTSAKGSAVIISATGNLTLPNGAAFGFSGPIANANATIGELYVCTANETLTRLEAPEGAANVSWTGNATHKYLTIQIAEVAANTTRLIIDGGSGLTDLSTYGYTLTAEGDVTVTGGEIVFSGNGDVDIGADFDLGVGAEPFQVEGFVTITDLTAGGLLLISHGGGAAAWNSTNGHQYILGYVDSGTLSLVCDWWNGSGISSASVSLFDGGGVETTALANATQTYVCVNYDGTNFRMYVGDTRHHQGAATFGGTSAATLLRLGKTASGDQNLTGSIEHFRVQMGAGITIHTAATITIPTPPFT